MTAALAQRGAGGSASASALASAPTALSGLLPWTLAGLDRASGERESAEDPCQRLDLHLAQSARVEDRLLRGQTHFPADRAAARLVLDAHPHAGELALARKRFRKLATAYLAGLGADQIIDLGCGLPLPPWLLQQPAPKHREIHHLARRGATVVHVDRDPLVMTHARALLAASEDSGVHVRHHEADLSDPAALLGTSGVPIRMDQPVVLLFFDVLHEIPDARTVLDIYKAAVPSGSWLVISHRSTDSPTGSAEASAYRTAGLPHTARTRDEIVGLVEGWEFLGPGVAPVRDWSPSLSPTDPLARRRASGYAVVARKP